MVILALSFNVSYWRLWLVILNHVLVWSRMRLRNSHVLFQTNDLCWENSKGLSTTPSWSPQSWSSTSHALQLSSLQYDQQLHSGETQEPEPRRWPSTGPQCFTLICLSRDWMSPENNSRSSPAQPKDEEATAINMHLQLTNTVSLHLTQLNVIHDMLTTWWINNQWTTVKSVFKTSRQIELLIYEPYVYLHNCTHSPEECMNSSVPWTCLA